MLQMVDIPHIQFQGVMIMSEIAIINKLDKIIELLIANHKMLRTIAHELNEIGKDEDER